MKICTKDKGIRKWSSVEGLMRIDYNPDERILGLKLDGFKCGQWIIIFNRFEQKQLLEFLEEKFRDIRDCNPRSLEEVE